MGDQRNAGGEPRFEENFLKFNSTGTLLIHLTSVLLRSTVLNVIARKKKKKKNNQRTLDVMWRSMNNHNVRGKYCNIFCVGGIVERVTESPRPRDEQYHHQRVCGKGADILIWWWTVGALSGTSREEQCREGICKRACSAGRAAVGTSM